jgi:vitamin B12 transporter
MKYPVVALLSLAAVAFTNPARGGEDSDIYELKPDLVVTPSRTVEPLHEALASVTIITRNEIELAAAEDLFELLRLQPGVDVVRTGGAGGQTSVFLRGSNSNHVLVLIDGVRAASANTGAYFWEQLPLNQIERVEIVRGPRGSLYGSDSIGGVIHIITRSSPDPYARVTGGSYGTQEFAGGLGHRGENSTISINAGYRDVRGFSAQNPDGFSYHPDDDGYRNTNLGIKGYAGVSAGEWHYSLLALNAESEFDQGTSDTEQRIGSVGFHGSFSETWNYQLLGGFVSDSLDSDFGFFTTGFDSKRYQLSWQNQLRTAAHGRLSFGLDWYRETGKSADSWSQSRNNAGIFGTYDKRFDNFLLQLSGRLDDNSRFGSEFTGQLALGYEIGESWQVSGSYGAAFRGPNLSEQYSPGFGGLFAGNPLLEPETSTTAEAGLSWKGGAAGTLSASLYRSDVVDLISFSGEKFQAVNIDKARLEGLELAYGLARGRWELNASATWQNAEDRTTGEPLLRRPDRKASLSVTRHFFSGSWLGLEGFYSGPRDDIGGIRLDSYLLLNLRAGWAFRPAWSVELRGENMTDEFYEPAQGFNAPGRAWYLSLAWMP